MYYEVDYSSIFPGLESHSPLLPSILRHNRVDQLLEMDPQTSFLITCHVKLVTPVHIKYVPHGESVARPAKGQKTSCPIICGRGFITN
jgi:hypothetical protein